MANFVPFLSYDKLHHDVQVATYASQDHRIVKQRLRLLAQDKVYYPEIIPDGIDQALRAVEAIGVGLQQSAVQATDEAAVNSDWQEEQIKVLNCRNDQLRDDLSSMEHELFLVRTAQGQHQHNAENLTFKNARLAEENLSHLAALSDACTQNADLEAQVDQLRAELQTRGQQVVSLITAKDKLLADHITLQNQAEHVTEDLAHEVREYRTKVDDAKTLAISLRGFAETIMAYFTTLSLGQLVMLLPEHVSVPFITSLTALADLDLYAEDAIPSLFTIVDDLKQQGQSVLDSMGETFNGARDKFDKLIHIFDVEIADAVDQMLRTNQWNTNRAASMQRTLRLALESYADAHDVPDGFAHLQNVAGSQSVSIAAPVHDPFSLQGQRTQVAAMVLHAEDKEDEWLTDDSDELA